MVLTPEADQASAGDFIFINHNAKRLRTIKDKSHRAVVNQHVQKAWLKNKRPKDQKVTRRPKAPDTTRRRPNDWTQEPEIEPSSGPYPTRPPQPAPYKTTQLIKFRAAPSRRPRRQKNEDVVPFAPFNILTHGNTDPFNTLAIPLDTTVSHLLQYGKEVMLPFVYSMEVRSTTPSLGIAKAWELVTLAFEDECAISAYLAISATSVMRVAPSSDLVRVALKYNNRSSALLRQKITDNKDSFDPRLYVIVLWLSANALATGDFTAGMIHANTLCFLVKQGGGIANLEPFQRESVLQFDIQFAIVFLRRPFFDANDYAPGPFNKAWLTDLEAVDHPSPDHALITYPPLTPSLTPSELALTLLDLRELYAVYVFTLYNQIPGTSPMFRWMYLQKHALEARLLDFCCTIIYSPIQQSSLTGNPSPSDSPSSTQTQSDIDIEYQSLLPPFCIAALYWTAMAVGYSKQKIHACSMFLIHLRSLLSTAAPHYFSPHVQRESNPNASLRLWILYVGSMGEQALGLSQPPDAWQDWCTRRFVLQMRWMGIHSHEQCREILGSVLFAEIGRAHV